MSNKNVIRVKWIIKWGETSIFIYNRFGSVLFGSVRLEYLSFGIRYFGILPDSVVHWFFFVKSKIFKSYLPRTLHHLLDLTLLLSYTVYITLEVVEAVVHGVDVTWVCFGVHGLDIWSFRRVQSRSSTVTIT